MLRDISREYTQKALIGEGRCIENMIHVMASRQDNAHVHCSAMRLLASLVLCEENRNVIYNVSGIEIIIYAMQRHKDTLLLVDACSIPVNIAI